MWRNSAGQRRGRRPQAGAQQQHAHRALERDAVRARRELLVDALAAAARDDRRPQRQEPRRDRGEPHDDRADRDRQRGAQQRVAAELAEIERDPQRIADRDDLERAPSTIAGQEEPALERHRDQRQRRRRRRRRIPRGEPRLRVRGVSPAGRASHRRSACCARIARRTMMGHAVGACERRVSRSPRAWRRPRRRRRADHRPRTTRSTSTTASRSATRRRSAWAAPGSRSSSAPPARCSTRRRRRSGQTTDTDRWSWDYHLDYLTGKYSSDYDNNGVVADQASGASAVHRRPRRCRYRRLGGAITLTRQTAPVAETAAARQAAERCARSSSSRSWFPRVDLAIGVGVQTVTFRAVSARRRRDCSRSPAPA